MGGVRAGVGGCQDETKGREFQLSGGLSGLYLQLSLCSQTPPRTPLT